MKKLFQKFLPQNINCNSTGLHVHYMLRSIQSKSRKAGTSIIQIQFLGDIELERV